MSKDNIYYGVGKPFIVYRRTVDYAISGFRWFEGQPNKQTDFFLEPAKTNFEYDRDVIEIYSEEEHRYFLRVNKPIIERGLLSVFTGEPTIASGVNALSDEDVLRIASISNVLELRKEIEQFTSDIPLIRIKNVMIEMDRLPKYIRIIDDRITQLRK